MKVLISGAGIAGPTLAYWLARYRFEPTIVEKAPQLRTGGYIIDFWGAGFDIAERMELLPEISRKGYTIQELRVVDSSGRKVAGFPTAAISQVMGGRFLSLPRGDLAATIFCQIERTVEMIFGDSVSRIDQDEKRVRVTFEHCLSYGDINGNIGTGYYQDDVHRKPEVRQLRLRHLPHGQLYRRRG